MLVPEGLQPEVAGEDRPVKAAPAAPLRVLVPSQLGPLGLEFQRHLLTRIEMAPPPAQRKLYRPLAEAGRSDFLDEVAGKISEYLSGVRRSPDLDYDLEAAGLDAFARRVLRQVARVPYGRTRTYKEIAALVGRKQAYRQVLAILERNPLPLVVPCHRIIPSRDGLGGYVGGVQRKRWLLRMEREHAAEFSAFCETAPPSSSRRPQWGRALAFALPTGEAQAFKAVRPTERSQDAQRAPR